MGNKRGHKGGTRRFTNPAEIAARKEKEDREKEWRRSRGEVIESDEEDEENSQDEESSDEDEKEAKLNELRKQSRSKQKEAEEEEEEDESEEEDPLIEICNPNRQAPKVKKDVNALADAKVVLSRREKEQLASQRSKTKETREDLARLALVKQKREEAARKREELSKQAGTSKSVAKK